MILSIYYLEYLTHVHVFEYQVMHVHGHQVISLRKFSRWWRNCDV